MNQPTIIRRLGITLVALTLALFIPIYIMAQDFPSIPHTLDKRDDCLACHEEGKLRSPKIPEDHIGRSNDICLDCHQPASEAPAPEEGAESETGFPPIPHTLENRADCLACHEEGKLGSTQIPEDHIGRSNDICLDCHQPASEAPAPEEGAESETGFPPIPHTLENRADCLACHEEGIGGTPQIPEDHAGRANDICQACHQPATEATTVEAEETEETGASPTPEDTGEIEATATPEETGETETTPTPEETEEAAEPADPLAIPHTLEGRENCLECHTSPEATPVSEPVSEAEEEGIPSIPHPLIGRENCLACHEEGIGGAPQIPEDHAGRPNDICQACHEPSQIPAAPTPTPITEPVPTPIAYPQTEGDDNTCLECHLTLEDEKHVEITTRWQRSTHAERNVACADCHGGDPSATTIDGAMSPEAGYIGVPAKADIPALCASCHADVGQMRQYDLPTDQWAKYKESIHGLRLAEGDTNVATCYDCHGGHQVLKANDPASSVYKSNVPAMCAGCHADEELMAPYDIPTNQYSLYQQSVHGHALLDNQDFRAPECATCHGTHGAAPPGFEEVANVCGSCHGATQEHYLKSPHASGGEPAPKCVTCHGRYDVSKPSEALYIGSEPRHCGECHTPDTEPGQVAQSLYDTITAAAQAYEEAEEAIQVAQAVGMIVGPMEGRLREANTDLITARAAQHTLDLDTVREHADSAETTAGEVKASAEAAVAESIFRRRAMIIAVAAIGLTIVALYLLKRELDRQLESES